MNLILTAILFEFAQNRKRSSFPNHNFSPGSLIQRSSEFSAVRTTPFRLLFRHTKASEQILAVLSCNGLSVAPAYRITCAVCAIFT
jgi:hypothetical protein